MSKKTGKCNDCGEKENEEQNNIVFSLTEADIQNEAREHIGRRLSEAEMNFFKNKFTIFGWDRTVRDFIDNLMDKDIRKKFGLD